MTKLVGIKTVKERSGFNSNTDTQLTVNAALEAASLYFESVLDTTFVREVAVDTFYLSSKEVPFQGDFPVLRLSKAFVDSAQPLTLEYANNWNTFDGDKLTIEPSKFVLNDKKGLIRLMGTDLDNTFIKATYTAGFNIDANESDLYDQSEVPGWLIEIADVYTQIMMELGTIITPGEPKSSIVQQKFSHVGTILAPHTRNGEGITPIL